jgi:large conductance mechanosensitive channel
MSTVREDFVKFINQGNLITLAIAFVIGAAFATLVMALVTDLITPLIGAAGDFNFAGLQTHVGKSVFLEGLFLNALISFAVILLVIFFAIALPYQRHQDRKAANAAATTRPCPECLTQIPIAATRCSACTSQVPPVPPVAPASTSPAKSA